MTTSTPLSSNEPKPIIAIGQSNNPDYMVVQYKDGITRKQLYVKKSFIDGTATEPDIKVFDTQSGEIKSATEFQIKIQNTQPDGSYNHNGKYITLRGQKAPPSSSGTQPTKVQQSKQQSASASRSPKPLSKEDSEKIDRLVRDIDDSIKIRKIHKMLESKIFELEKFAKELKKDNINIPKDLIDKIDEAIAKGKTELENRNKAATKATSSQPAAANESAAINAAIAALAKAEGKNDIDEKIKALNSLLSGSTPLELKNKADAAINEAKEKLKKIEEEKEATQKAEQARLAAEQTAAQARLAAEQEAQQAVRDIQSRINALNAETEMDKIINQAIPLGAQLVALYINPNTSDKITIQTQRDEIQSLLDKKAPMEPEQKTEIQDLLDEAERYFNRANRALDNSEDKRKMEDAEQAIAKIASQIIRLETEKDNIKGAISNIDNERQKILTNVPGGPKSVLNNLLMEKAKLNNKKDVLEREINGLKKQISDYQSRIVDWLLPVQSQPNQKTSQSAPRSQQASAAAAPVSQKSAENQVWDIVKMVKQNPTDDKDVIKSKIETIIDGNISTFKFYENLKNELITLEILPEKYKNTVPVKGKARGKTGGAPQTPDEKVDAFITRLNSDIQKKYEKITENDNKLLDLEAKIKVQISLLENQMKPEVQINIRNLTNKSLSENAKLQAVEQKIRNLRNRQEALEAIKNSANSAYTKLNKILADIQKEFEIVRFTLQTEKTINTIRRGVETIRNLYRQLRRESYGSTATSLDTSASLVSEYAADPNDPYDQYRILIDSITKARAVIDNLGRIYGPRLNLMGQLPTMFPGMTGLPQPARNAITPYYPTMPMGMQMGMPVDYSMLGQQPLQQGGEGLRFFDCLLFSIVYRKNNYLDNAIFELKLDGGDQKKQGGGEGDETTTTDTSTQQTSEQQSAATTGQGKRDQQSQQNKPGGQQQPNQSVIQFKRRWRMGDTDQIPPELKTNTLSNQTLIKQLQNFILAEKRTRKDQDNYKGTLQSYRILFAQSFRAIKNNTGAYDSLNNVINEEDSILALEMILGAFGLKEVHSIVREKIYRPNLDEALPITSKATNKPDSGDKPPAFYIPWDKADDIFANKDSFGTNPSLLLSMKLRSYKDGFGNPIDKSRCVDRDAKCISRTYDYTFRPEDIGWLALHFVGEMKNRSIIEQIPDRLGAIPYRLAYIIFRMTNTKKNSAVMSNAQRKNIPPNQYNLYYRVDGGTRWQLLSAKTVEEKREMELNEVLNELYQNSSYTVTTLIYTKDYIPPVVARDTVSAEKSKTKGTITIKVLEQQDNKDTNIVVKNNELIVYIKKDTKNLDNDNKTIMKRLIEHIQKLDWSDLTINMSAQGAGQSHKDSIKKHIDRNKGNLKNKLGNTVSVSIN